MNSILISIKKMLGITEEYTQFDQDIIIHINSVFMILNQIGVGPEECFSIEDSSSTWDDFMEGNNKIKAVETYMYLKVRLLFDPPTNAGMMDAINRAASELECRLQVATNK